MKAFKYQPLKMSKRQPMTILLIVDCYVMLNKCLGHVSHDA